MRSSSSGRWFNTLVVMGAMLGGGCNAFDEPGGDGDSEPLRDRVAGSPGVAPSGPRFPTGGIGPIGGVTSVGGTGPTTPQVVVPTATIDAGAVDDDAGVDCESAACNCNPACAGCEVRFCAIT